MKSKGSAKIPKKVTMFSLKKKTPKESRIEYSYDRFIPDSEGYREFIYGFPPSLFYTDRMPRIVIDELGKKLDIVVDISAFDTDSPAILHALLKKSGYQQFSKK